MKPFAVLAVIALFLAVGIANAQDARDAQEHARAHEAGVRALQNGDALEAIAAFELCDELEPWSLETAYNLACAHAQAGSIDEAFEWLSNAARWAYSNADHARTDPDLAPLRADPRFEAALEAMDANLVNTINGRLMQVEARARARRSDHERYLSVLESSPVQWLDGHTSAIWGVVFGPDGRRVLTWGTDGAVWLWDAQTGGAVARLGIHAIENNAGGFELGLWFSEDGERILVYSPNEGDASLWDGRSGELIALMREGDEVLESASLCADGREVVTATGRGVVRFWDAARGRLLSDRTIRTTPGVLLVEVSRDGKHVLTVNRDRRARLWEADSGALLGTLGSAQQPLIGWRSINGWYQGYAERGARFSSDGTRVLGHGAGGVALSFDVGAPAAQRVFRPDSGSWTSLRWSPDGSRLFVAGSDGSDDVRYLAELRDGVDGSLLASLGAGTFDGEAWKDWQSYPARFAQESSRLVAKLPSGVWLWDALAGGAIWDASPELSPPLDDTVFSRDGRWMASVASSRAMIWSTIDGRQLVDTPLVAQAIELALDPHEPRLAVGMRNGAALIIDAADGETLPLASRTRFAGARLSPDGTTAVSLAPTPDGSEGATVRVWDLATGVTRHTLRTPDGSVEDAAFDARAERLVVTARRGGGYELSVFDLILGEVVAEMRSPFRIGSVALSSDGTHVLSEGLWRVDTASLVRSMGGGLTRRNGALSPNGATAVLSSWKSIEIVDVASGEASGRLSIGKPIRDIAVSNSGLVAVASGDGLRGPGVIRVWDPASSAEARILRGHQSGIWSVAFSPDGARLVTAGHDRTVRVWNLDGTSHILRGHMAWVTGAVFSPDGKRVLSWGPDNTARVWDSTSGEQLALLTGHTADVDYGAFTPDGTRILTSGDDATARVWDATTGRLLMTRVEYADGGWLAFEPKGHYVDGGAAAEWARIEVKGKTYPLSSYARELRAPERVAQSAAGSDVPEPDLSSHAPELAVFSPQSGIVNERAIQLEAVVRDDYGIDGITVLQDGEELSADWVEAGLSAPYGGRSLRLSRPLEIPEGRSSTTLRVRASNVRGIQSAVETAHVRYAPGRRKLYLLAIGVSDYDDDALDLAYPVKDAQDLVERFRLEAGGLYDEVLVEQLADRAVQPSEILRLREEFLLQAQPEDTIVVFVAGHGVRSPSNEYYFLTSTATPDRPYTGIERSVLESLVTWDKLWAERRVLLLDTCHSGDAFGGEARRGVAADAYRQSEVDEQLGKGLYILAASTDEGFALEMNENGLFTRALIQGLDGAADDDEDGVVDIEELKQYASRVVHEQSGGRQRPTVPRVQGGEGFQLARVRE